MSEQVTQTKILKWLKANDFWCFKTIVSSHKGIMDIVGCTPKGRFFGIEVKYGANKPSELQSYHVEQVKIRGGIAFVAWDLETVIANLHGEIAYVQQPTKQKQFIL